MYFKNSYSDYSKEGKWFSENCTDPKLLYESIVAKPNELLKSLYFQYYDKEDIDEITDFEKNVSEIWSTVDDYQYGRCVQINPTNEMISYGIRKVDLKFRSPVKVMFQTLGDFETSRLLSNSNEPEWGSYIRIDIDYEVFDLLDFGGQPCTPGKIQLCMYYSLYKHLINFFSFKKII